MPEKPLCRYFGECGGCQAQHVPYEVMLKNKKNFVAAQLKKNNIAAGSDISIIHGKPYNYRNRMDFIVFEEGLGLRRKDKFSSIVKIERCEIANERINSLLLELQDWFSKNKEAIDPYNLKAQKGTVRYAVIRSPDFSKETTVSFAINDESAKQEKAIEAIKRFSEATTADNVVLAKIHGTADESTSLDFFAIKGKDTLNEFMLEKKLEFSSQGFFQNNSEVAGKMVEHAKNILMKHDTKEATLIDLYGGVGTFGIALSSIFSKVHIIESFEKSIDSAKINIRENNADNSYAHCKDASSMEKIAGNAKNIFVITDPPRSGMSQKAIKDLIGLSPKAIIYISCNPQVFAKEMKAFSKHYGLKSVTVFDMFPQTNHIETIAELVLRMESLKE